MAYVGRGSNTNDILIWNGTSWILSGSAGFGGGADPNASYLVVGLTGSLSNERALVGGTGIDLVDGGANTGLTASIDDSVVATISGAIFSGVTTHQAGLSGSLTRLSDGTSYIAGGDNIAISSASNGQVTIIGNAQGADPGASYIVVGNTASLANERALVGGPGINLVDGGANTGLTASIDDSVVATVSGTTFTGDLKVNGDILAANGTVTNPSIGWLSDDDGTGTGFFRPAADQIAITLAGVKKWTVSFNQIAGATAEGPQVSNLTPSDTVPTLIPRRSDANTGIGSFGADALSLIAGGVEAMRVLPGSLEVAGDVTMQAGLTGSLQKTAGGLSYLAAGDNVTVTSASNGQVTVSSPSRTEYLRWGGDWDGIGRFLLTNSNSLAVDQSVSSHNTEDVVTVSGIMDLFIWRFSTAGADTEIDILVNDVVEETVTLAATDSGVETVTTAVVANDRVTVRLVSGTLPQNGTCKLRIIGT